MSLRKTDRVFHPHNGELCNKKIAKIIADALRSDFGDLHSSVKEIDRATGIAFNTVKKCYEASTVPSVRHFLLLLKCSPSLREFILLYLFGDDILDDLALISRVHSEGSIDTNAADFKPKNVPINVPIKLNKRQKWFLLKLKHDSISAQNLAQHWNIDIKTARRDIKVLKDAGMICFIGSRKTGRYEIIQRDEY